MCIRYVSDAPKTQPGAWERSRCTIVSQNRLSVIAIPFWVAVSITYMRTDLYSFYFREGASFNEGRCLEGIDVGAA